MKVLLLMTACLFVDSFDPAITQAQPATPVDQGLDEKQAKESVDQAAETKKAMRSLGIGMSFFYRKPEARQFERLNLLMDQHEETILKVSKRNRFNLISAKFLARVHEKHKFPISSQGQIGDLARAIIAKDKNNKDAVFVNDPKLITASKLDLLWVSFSATGDTKYVESILNVTGNPKTKKVNGLLNIPVVAAANWSFKSNCSMHKPVFEFAVSASKLEKWAAQKTFLDHCISSAKARDASLGSPKPQSKPQSKPKS